MNFFGSSPAPSSSDDSFSSSSFDSGSSFDSSMDSGASSQVPAAPVLSLDQLKHANMPIGMSMSPYLQIDPSVFRTAQPQYVTPDGGEHGRTGMFEFVLGHIGCAVGAGFFTGCTRGFLSELTNPETRQLGGKPWMTRMVNATMKHGSSYAQISGSAVVLFSIFQIGLKQLRADDDLNSLAAGAITGAIYRSPYGARASAVGAAAGTLLATAWVVGHPDSRQRVSQMMGLQ
uniref:Mitochondrial import inner membrane translocase subunit tim23 n=1 Tax=Steinernema glaseri TaxID=37863 RepID=A0A1I7YPF7_9BILA